MMKKKLQAHVFHKDFVETFVIQKINIHKTWYACATRSGKQELFAIFEEEGNHYIETCAKATFSNGKCKKKLKESMHLQLYMEQERYHVVIEPFEDQYVQYKPMYCDEVEICIGRHSDCAICYQNQYISSMHARIYQQDASWWLEDLHSANGTYVNGSRIQRTPLQEKDCVQIMQLKLVWMNDFFLMNAIEECKLSSCVKQYSFTTQSNAVHLVSNHIQNYSIPSTFEEVCYCIDSPPPTITQKRMPLLFVIGPALTMGLSSISMGIFSLLQISQQNSSIMQSVPTLIMAFSMGAGTLLWPLLSRRYEKREHYRLHMIREDTYHSYLRDIQTNIEKDIQAYQQYQQKLYHTTTHCMVALQKHNILRYSKLHPTYQRITLGIGSRSYPCQFDYRSQGYVIEKDMLQTELEQLCHKEYIAQDVPIALSLSTFDHIHIAQEGSYTYMLDLLFQLAMTHDEKAIPMVCFMDYEVASTYGVVWLPHMKSAHSFIRRIVYDEQSFLRICEDIQNDPSDLYVFFFVDTFQKQWQARMHTYAYHICEFTMEEEIQCSNEPRHAYIAINDKQEGICIENFTTWSFQCSFLSQEQYHQCAIALANLEEMTLTHSQEIGQVKFLDLYACGSVKKLDVEQRWMTSDASTSLKVCIGKVNAQEFLYLDAHEHFDGAHGLFAGMTGSGKSEGLLTYILSLALQFSPQDVSFLLIDYKGGGMAKVCAKLPHIAGIITNLDQDIMQRSLYAIQNELKRRQKAFNQCAKTYNISNMNMNVYHNLSKLYPDVEPMPHLFIIADEFAELKMAQQEFMDTLKRSARIGRSLGIHLILATQKPAGVIDDQIWSNAHFHLCMKVQSTQDSHDMLRKDDAAYLKQSGSCYLQVGLDEVYKKGQLAWSTCPYIEQEDYMEEAIKEVRLVRGDGSIIASKQLCATHVSTSQTTQMEAVLDEIKKVAKKLHMQATPLWKQPLAKKLYASQYAYANYIVDDMRHQQQHLLYFDDMYKHHHILYGMQKKDKELYLESFLYYVIHLAQECVVYMFDFDTHHFKGYEKYQHIADVVLESEEEKVERFFYMLQEEVKKRKRQTQYLPMIWILHHYEVFHERYEVYEHTLVQLLREGEAYALSIIITTTSPTSISYRLSQYIAHRFVFHMHDKHDYGQLFSTHDPVLPNAHVGSGLCLYQEDVVAFQMLCLKEEDWNQAPCVHRNTYRIPIMPKHIAHPLHLVDDKLYLGKQCDRVQDYYISLHTACYFFFYQYQCYKPFYTMILQSLMKQGAYIIRASHILYNDTTINEEEFLMALQQHSFLVVWIGYAFANYPSIQAYMSEEEADTHTHIFLCSMQDYMEYTRHSWFQRKMQESRCLWIGKGYEECSFQLRFAPTKQKECKACEGYLWEETTCIKLQLWEVEDNG